MAVGAATLTHLEVVSNGTGPADSSGLNSGPADDGVPAGVGSNTSASDSSAQATLAASGQVGSS
jgi:hypothetical protein